MNHHVLIIETTDYESFPIGGQLTFAKNLLKTSGNCLVLAGAVADDTIVGEWTEKTIDGIQFPFFAYIGIPSKMNNKPIIP